MRRRLIVVLLVLGLCLASIVPLEILLSGSRSFAAGSNFKPSTLVATGVDDNGNRISDALDSSIGAMSSNSGSAPTNVIVMLNVTPGTVDKDAFSALGGVVTSGLWSHALYGFAGRIPIGNIAAFVSSRSNVLLVESDAECNATVAYAAEQVGARPYVWSSLGLRGDQNSSLAVLDTGIDGSHVDFAPGYGNGNFSEKIVGWNDQIGSSTAPYDDEGHGSHVSGLAAGDGFFSVNSAGYATATWGESLGTISTTNTYLLSGMMVNMSGPINVSVRWNSTGTGALSSLPLDYGGKNLSSGSWSQVGSVSTPLQNTWYKLSYNVASTPSGGYDMYHVLGSFTRGTGSIYVTFNMSWPYVAPTDGFSAWTGLAPDSKLVGVKVLDSSGSGSSSGLISGLDWLIANRVAYHVTVASMSLGFTSEQSSVDSALVNLVNSGITTIVAAGNSGSGSNYIYTPGSVDEVLTVAAMNQFDNVASYSSQGGPSHSTGNTIKPDVLAPGGSFFGVPLFSASANYNVSAPMQGTSMATPVVAGAAQDVVDALGGFAGWNYTRSQALMPKMLLLMTATETYPNLRESGTTATSPTLDRGGKDAQEGYGRLNVDAAADAVLKPYLVGTTVVDGFGSPPSTSNISVLGQRLAWARNVQLFSGIMYNFSLNVPVAADDDLYLYNTTGNTYGEPVILAKSTTAAAGANESIAYAPAFSGEYFVVVKRATETTGGGQFTLSSSSNSSSAPILFSDNFDYGNLTTLNSIWKYTDSPMFVPSSGSGFQNTTGSFGGLDSSIYHSAGYSAKFTLAPQTNAAAILYKDTMNKQFYDTLYMSNWVYVTTLPPNGQYLMFGPTLCSWHDFDLVAAYVYNDSGIMKWSVLYYTNAGSDLNFNTTALGPTIQTNTWYNIQVMATIGHGNGKAVMWVNGIKVSDANGLINDGDLGPNGEIGIRYLQIGSFEPYWNTQGFVTTVYADDVKVSAAYMKYVPTSTPHLLLSVDPNQSTYVKGQSLTLKTTVLNDMNPALNSTLALTVTGPNGYYHYDFQTISVAGNSVGEYNFTWTAPNATGTYIVETGLVPPLLTAYDVKWLSLT